MRLRGAGAAVAAAAALVVAAACAGDGSSGPPPEVTTAAPASPSASPSPSRDALLDYTDRGDACDQAASAISYADAVLVDLGQEQYQDFSDAVRSRLAAVAGTVALEARDWPDAAVARQAAVLQPLAEAAAARAPDGDEARIRALLRYRIEAGRLLLLCRYPEG